MRRTRQIRTMVVLTLAFALAVGVGAVAFTDAHAKGPCRCPQIYAPVQCDNGKIYPNQCVADCRNGRNCVPTGIL